MRVSEIYHLLTLVHLAHSPLKTMRTVIVATSDGLAALARIEHFLKIPEYKITDNEDKTIEMGSVRIDNLVTLHSQETFRTYNFMKSKQETYTKVVMDKKINMEKER